jgi:hypothetical protein
MMQNFLITDKIEVGEKLGAGGLGIGKKLSKN